LQRAVISRSNEIRALFPLILSQREKWVMSLFY
jgi:hypothetical protein